jgi:DNA-binding transcriptional MerR regulator
MPHCGILNMRTYSVSEAARALGIDRRTLQRWVRENLVPVPTTQVIGGMLSRSWTEKDLGELREYKAARYWGKGKKRRKGKIVK